MKDLIPGKYHQSVDSDEDSEGSIAGQEMNESNNPISSNSESDLLDENTDELNSENEDSSEDNFVISDEDEFNNMTDTDSSGDEEKNKGSTCSLKSSLKRQREDSDEEQGSDEEECDATMLDIFDIKPNQEANRETPPTLKTESEVFDICFSPVKEIFATGDICGNCILYRYNIDSVEEICCFSHHLESCRQVCFDEEGKLLYTISSDMSLGILDMESGKLKSHQKNIHDAPISSFYELRENVYATGDDEGTVKLWDSRSKESVKSFECSPVGRDAISSLLSSSKEDYLCATCMDGSITAINLRKLKIQVQSEMYKTEFTSQSMLRYETKLVVGGDKEPGRFTIFNWGEFGCHNDSLAGLPSGILSQACVSENLILVGCADSTIRAVNFFPHRLIGVVGQHDANSAGIDSLAVSYDGKILASCASDNLIQFWDISKLYKKKMTDKKKGKKKLAVNRNLASSRERNRWDFFADIPQKIESDNEDERGPVASTSYQDVDSD